MKSAINKKGKSTDESTVCLNRVSKYIDCNEFSTIRENLLSSASTVCEIHNIKDVILKSSTEKNKDRTNLLNEKYILRWAHGTEDEVELIKECSKGRLVKSITEKISVETALRIVDRSTKWLCTSISPLLREVGVKMTTERLRPEAVMSFDRESFNIENRLKITADSGIVLCDYDEALNVENFKSTEPVDKNVCLLQVNYDRIIPDHISSLIGIKAN